MRSSWLLALPLFLSLACGDDSPSAPAAGSTCTAGQQISCPCPGGGVGVQICESNGSAFGACTGCGMVTAGQGGAGGGGAGGAAGQSAGGMSAGGMSGSGGTSGVGGAGGSGGMSGAGGACSPQSTALKLVPSRVLVLLDRSGSMDDSGKWTAAVNALHTILDQASDATNIGLMRFPEGTPTTCSNPTDLVCTTDFECTDIKDTPNVPVGPLAQTRPQIYSLLDATSPNGGTPTLWALKKSWKALKAEAGEGERVVLLITDGDPTLHSVVPMLGDFAKACGEKMELATETTAAYEQTPSVRTVVIGAPGVSAAGLEILSGIAQLGGGCRPGGSFSDFTCHYQIGSTNFETNLAQNVGEVLASVSGCRFRLDAPLTSPAQLVIASAQGQTVVPESATDGWAYADDQKLTIQLAGAACKQAYSDKGATVEFVSECP